MNRLRISACNRGVFSSSLCHVVCNSAGNISGTTPVHLHNFSRSSGVKQQKRVVPFFGQSRSFSYKKHKLFQKDDKSDKDIVEEEEEEGEDNGEEESDILNKNDGEKKNKISPGNKKEKGKDGEEGIEDEIAEEKEEEEGEEEKNELEKGEKADEKERMYIPARVKTTELTPHFKFYNRGGFKRGALNAWSIPTPPMVEAIPLLKKPIFPGTMFSISTTDDNIARNLHHSENKLFGLFLVNQSVRSKDNFEPISGVSELEKVGVLVRVLKTALTPYGLVVIFIALRRIMITGAVETILPEQRTKPDTLKQSPDVGPISSTSTGTGVGVGVGTMNGKKDRGASDQKRGFMDGDIAPMKGESLITVKIKEFQNIQSSDKTMRDAIFAAVLDNIRELAKLNPFFKEQLDLYLDHIDLQKQDEVSDVAAYLTTVDIDKLQDILATARVEDRMRKALELLKTEVETARIQVKIQKDLDTKINQSQRKFYLTEQLKIIKKELGLEKDEKESLIKKFQERMASKTVPEETMKVFNEEINKLQTLEPSSSEYNVCRSYLEWLTILPWGVYTPEKFDIPKAKKILDSDHYGLKALKERILEFIGVGKLKGSVVGKIICFVGPPGTGKTSVGKSIARALGREFYRFSVGGMYDVAEIKGHRRTYIGAMPGKLIQVLKLAKSANPVIMIDEIDKLGRGHGDPASALLEVLDPEQNTSFLDHYLDVPFDLSKVLFICTANMLDTVPKPLLDRMEILRLSGYIQEEKVNIAKRHLIPNICNDTGINPKKLKIEDDTLSKIIREYCREAGVRSFQQHIEKIMRKVAFKIASGEHSASKVMRITDSNIGEFLGKPKFSSDRYYVTAPVGVTMGLAWTELGGSVLYIETTVEPHKGKLPSSDDGNSDNEARFTSGSGGGLRCTGKLGDVMKESSLIAYTVAKKVLSEKLPQNDFFFNNFIHMHVPEGATPKDGPSAGITMTTSLMSLALGKKVKQNLAMTGELTITGKVLPIGGLKEKTIAARRAGVVDIIFPKDNEQDWAELDAEIRKGLVPHFVDYYEDVYGIAFNYNEEENQRMIDADKKSAKEKQPLGKQSTSSANSSSLK